MTAPTETDKYPDISFLQPSIGTNCVTDETAQLVTEYLIEADHNGWEGWEEWEREVITYFLEDMAKFIRTARDK